MLSLKIFTADKNIILFTAGRLCENKIRDTVNAVIKIISSSPLRCLKRDGFLVTRPKGNMVVLKTKT